MNRRWILLACVLLGLLAGGCQKREVSRQQPGYNTSPEFTKGEYQPRKTTNYHMGPTRFRQND